MLTFFSKALRHRQRQDNTTAKCSQKQDNCRLRLLNLQQTTFMARQLLKYRFDSPILGFKLACDYHLVGYGSGRRESGVTARLCNLLGWDLERMTHLLAESRGRKSKLGLYCARPCPRLFL